MFPTKVERRKKLVPSPFGLGLGFDSPASSY
nr:MAG TPA: hypothetical protein [Caudoviricetes sp.]